MNQKVASVSSVCFNIEKSNPPQLSVHAIGKVSSSGWANATLVPRIYVVQPTDGIQDFDFLANAPSGNVLWVICPISAVTTVELEKWVKGVRVNSVTNNFVANLNDISCSVTQGPLMNHVLLFPDGTLTSVSMEGDGGGGENTSPYETRPRPGSGAGSSAGSGI